MIKGELARVAPSRAGEFANLRLGASLDDLALESITTLELVNALEVRLGTTFLDEELMRVHSLTDLVGMVRRAIGP